MSNNPVKAVWPPCAPYEMDIWEILFILASPELTDREIALVLGRSEMAIWGWRKDRAEWLKTEGKRFESINTAPVKPVRPGRRKGRKPGTVRLR